MLRLKFDTIYFPIYAISCLYLNLITLMITKNIRKSRKIVIILNSILMDGVTRKKYFLLSISPKPYPENE